MTFLSPASLPTLPVRDLATLDLDGSPPRVIVSDTGEPLAVIVPYPEFVEFCDAIKLLTEEAEGLARDLDIKLPPLP